MNLGHFLFLRGVPIIWFPYGIKNPLDDPYFGTQNNSNSGDEIRAERNKRTSPPTALDVCGPVNSYGYETCYNFVPTHRI